MPKKRRIDKEKLYIFEFKSRPKLTHTIGIHAYSLAEAKRKLKRVIYKDKYGWGISKSLAYKKAIKNKPIVKKLKL